MMRDNILDLVREAGVVRPRDLEAAGLAGSYLSRLARQGELERVGRGLYTLAGAPPSEHRSLAEVAKRVPRGVVCLLSALRFHELSHSGAIRGLARDRAEGPHATAEWYAPANRALLWGGARLWD